jgi:hypothetical protein
LWCTVKETRSFSVPANRIRDWSWNYEDKPYKLRINYLSGEGEVKSVLISMEGDRNNEIDALLEDVTGKKSTPYVPQGQANVEEKCSKAADYKGCMEYHKSN